MEGEAWSDPFHYSLVHDPTPPSAPEITCELNEFYDIRATFPKPMGPDHHDEIISYFKVWRANASGAVVGDAFDLSQGTPEGASLLVRIPSADNSPEEHLRVEVGPVPDRTGRMSPAAFKVFDSDCIEVP